MAVASLSNRQGKYQHSGHYSAPQETLCLDVASLLHEFYTVLHNLVVDTFPKEHARTVIETQLFQLLLGC